MQRVIRGYFGHEVPVFSRAEGYAKQQLGHGVQAELQKITDQLRVGKPLQTYHQLEVLREWIAGAAGLRRHETFDPMLTLPRGRTYEVPFRQRGRAQVMRSLRAAAARDERQEREAARARLQAQEAQLGALRLEVDLERQALRQVCTGCLRLRARERKVHAKTVEDLGAMAMAGARKCASCFAKEAASSAVERHHPRGREQGAAGTASEGAGRETEAGAPEEADALEAQLSELRTAERQIARGATPEFRARMLDKARELRSDIKRLEQRKKVSLMQQRVAARKAATRKVARPPSATARRPHRRPYRPRPRRPRLCRPGLGCCPCRPGQHTQQIHGWAEEGHPTEIATVILCAPLSSCLGSKFNAQRPKSSASKRASSHPGLE